MAALSNSVDFNITPSRKRKRQFDKYEEQESSIQTKSATTSCFTNAAFCSTPKKVFAKRRIQSKKNEENVSVSSNKALEVKCIPGISEIHKLTEKASQNPYEVLRRPPKKKKCHTAEAACFENSALNLEFPEKLFNPYEVVRENAASENYNCFSNPALNLKTQDTPYLRNPFEVQRVVADSDMEELNTRGEVQSIVNFAITPGVERQPTSLPPKPCQFKLCLPFVPKVGCRIDFKDVSISQLTPSKLLAEKLVFSPVQKAKLSLGSIEEESTMDIGKELDLYQLELENSINEGKLRKTGVTKANIPLSPPDANYEIKIVQPKFKQTLSDISEDVENGQTEHLIEQNTNILDTNPFGYDINKHFQKTETAEVVEIENLDELYGCSSDGPDDQDSFDFKNPTPFVRAYTKQDATCTNLVVSKKSQESLKYNKSTEPDGDSKKSLNVKNIIRKSIRKLMHTHQKDHHNDNDNPVQKPEYEKEHGFINAIRQSFRRKLVKNIDEESPTKNEISIIDSTERTMKLKSDVLQTEDLTKEKKHNLRNSVRKSTREVRHQFLKSVFHKKHEYDFKN